jgi:recombinational DNA repair protein (RecF pathway)
LVDCAGNIADKELPELLVDKSHAFNSWQKQKCREVLKATRMIPVLGNALHTIAELPQDRREEARKELAILLDKIHEEWLPAVIELDDQTSVAEYLEDYLLPLSLEQDRDLEDELHKEF